MESPKFTKPPDGESIGLPARFRNMLEGEKVQVIPGVVDVITAKIAHKEGFRAIYFSGAAFAMSMGLPNPRMIPMQELTISIQRIVAAVRAPLIVDIDAEIGEGANLTKTVLAMETAGAAAIVLGDQPGPNRAEPGEITPVVRAEPLARRLATAKSARRDDLVIIARTDARSSEGLQQVIDRANFYLATGADAIFAEGLERQEDFAELSKSVKGPLITNLAESGPEPSLDAYVLGELGYKAVLFPHSPFRVALRAVANSYRRLRRFGTQHNLIDVMITQREIDDLLDYNANEEGPGEQRVN